jgi:hypothetical protein
MPIERYFSSTAVAATLSGNINAAATSITVSAVTGFPGTKPYTLALDYGGTAEELVDVTASAGTTLTVTRGVDGTSAQSHSTGAAVRHVASARDFAAYQTHQSNTSSVHGVNGNVVGTSDTQTLSNKTLTSPLVNSATLAGTISGTPTINGVFSFPNGYTVGTGAAPVYTFSTTTTGASDFKVTGDANPRLRVQAGGALLWGDGTAALDTTLYREAANVLTTDDILRVIRPTTTDNAFSVRLTTDTTASHFLVLGDGTLNWGPGGTTATDTSLARSGVAALTSNSTFTATVETTTSGLTAATDFSVTSFNGRRTCGVATVRLLLSYTGATITSSATGNIGDTLACTLPSGWRPHDDFVVNYDKSGVASGSCTILSDGTCTLKTLDPTATITSGSSITITASFVL